MLLAIEQGNTNTLFAVHTGTQWVAQWRGATDARRTADEYAVWLFQIMTMHNFKAESVRDVVISSVVPQSLFHLRNLSRRYLNVEPMVVGEGADSGVVVKIDRPEEAGADRLVAARAARDHYGSNVFIVDSGTATTIDVVDPSGAFCGGIIAPGINLSLQALHQAAAKLPKIAIQRPPAVIGRNTIHAMQSGIFWGYVSLIDGLIDRMAREFGKPDKVIATGGVASLFEGASERITLYDADLSLKGLYAIWQDAQKGN
jgi:type III pantothenate kinase